MGTAGEVLQFGTLRMFVLSSGCTQVVVQQAGNSAVLTHSLTHWKLLLIGIMSVCDLISMELSLSHILPLLSLSPPSVGVQAPSV